MNLTTRYSVKCVMCGALPGQLCRGARGERKSVHIERWQRKLKKDAKRKEKTG